jgi:DNA mismatch repair protein MutS
MMRQYYDIRKKFPGCLLFYRMGDFYELFLEDAHIGAKVLNITLTSKAGGKDGRIPMAGIPYHAVDSYLAKLIKAGYKVAICEQLSPPNTRGLVKRDVVRVVTPGTMLDENTLEKKENNYLVSIVVSEGQAAIAVADLSTGYFAVSEKEGVYQQWLLDELARLSPSECILPDPLYNDASLLGILKTQQGMNIYSLKSWNQYAKHASKLLKEHFEVRTLAAFGIEEKPLACECAAALLGYLQETQMTTVKHIRAMHVYESDSAMVLDKSTMINLELFSTIRDHDTHGSLLSVLDDTVTAMGGRLLKLWLKKPLITIEDVTARHDGVGVFLAEHKKRESVRNRLEEVSDVERILSRLSVNIGNARDLVNIQKSLEKILEIRAFLEHDKALQTNICSDISRAITPEIRDVISHIKHTIVPEPPIDTKNGGMIQSGIHAELDKLRGIVGNSKDWISELEKSEREKTGIGSLKIRYNQVFGFYIEISKSNLHLAPKTYMRKQTLVNAERFTTNDLKKHEEIILTAQEKANELEYQLFTEVLTKVLEYTPSIQQAAFAIGTLDCITTFATISQKYGYTRPTLRADGEIHIDQGRHPVVERLLGMDTQFVPNGTKLDNTSQSVLLITGPNMAGKSVYIRQVALIVLLCQIGCFVPAKTANLSLVDRIFVRSGASDVITSGLSTFMVEMVETAQILRNATEKSLIIMDEIGRGTSTYDGISIAWSVAQYIATHFQSAPKTLFATHYHELQMLETEYPHSIKNFHMAVAGEAESPIFLHTLFPGGASHSFGIAVAKLAGIPDDVLREARTMLKHLEERSQSQSASHDTATLPTAQDKQSVALYLIQNELAKIDIAHMTPMDAMNKLAQLQEQVKIIQTASKAFRDID